LHVFGFRAFAKTSGNYEIVLREDVHIISYNQVLSLANFACLDVSLQACQQD
jgi:hypothetical protein